VTSAALSAPPAQEAAAAEPLRQLAVTPLAPAGARTLRLLDRLRAPERAIDAAYRRLTNLPRAVIERSRAAEWLLDNHYVVQRAVRGLKEEFPAGFERKLRPLAEGSWRGLPLVYAVARAIADTGQGRVDVDSLASAIADFQSQRSLTIAELWALPALLRLALIEQLAAATGALPGGEAPAAAPHAAEGEAGRVIASAIRSLRALESADWKQFFEAASIVERILGGDPAGVYRQMDFDSRDQYRKAVEEIAAGSRRTDEEAVATLAVDLARAGGDPPRSHVGFFLLAAGRDGLERRAGSHPRWRVRWRRFLLTHPTACYLGPIGGIGTGLLVAFAAGAGVTGPAEALVTVALALIPAVAVAVNLANAVFTRLVPPRALPKLDFSHAVPATWRTLVAVPAMLSDDDEIDALLAGLEIRYLANTDAQVHFVLLTDFRDAPERELPSDAALLAHAVDGIAALNARHQRGGGGPFHLLHRTRQWNAAEACWMGWERKRGKLAALNRWILGRPGADFAVNVGDPAFRAGVHFVIVLDADTDLPRDAAHQLIGALAHPLNRAQFAADSGAVAAGYTVLQPRVEISPLSAGTSRFSKLFSPAAGLDPYTRAVSEIYQDLFGKGTFIGKGIYDVADFERSLDDVVPDNALLSHDLFEGLHGRAGLVSDTVLFEDFPSHYLAYTRRFERWVRGDWQLLPWLGRLVPTAGGARRRNRLTPIARWKILDNLRRSLTAPALVALLLAGWFLFPSRALLYTAIAVCVPGVPALLDLVEWVRSARPQRGRGAAATPDPESLRPSLSAWFCELAFLPHTAAVAVGAVARTLFRVYVTRRHLLQWTAAAHMARSLAAGDSALLFWREMAAAPLLAVAVAALLAAFHPRTLTAAAPLLALWLAAPALAQFLSRPRLQSGIAPTDEDLRRLHVLARRTWAFFETFVGPADQWLPPDHFQEDPRGAPARRTSPTNIGMYLLSVLAAADLSYRGALATALALKNTFDTLDRMDRHRGHFLNWYGTADLQPLEPRYVSTVDSGNLAACLLTVKQGCLELLDGPVVPAQRWSGYLDTLAVFRRVITAAQVPECTALLRVVDEIEHTVERCRASPARWRDCVAELLSVQCAALDRQLVALLEPDPTRLETALLAELRAWSVSHREHLEHLQRELDLLLPWMDACRRLPTRAAGDWTAEGTAARQELAALAGEVPRVVELPAAIARARQAVDRLRAALPAEGAEPGIARWATELDAALAAAAQSADYLVARLREAADRAAAFARDMDFAFLYDGQRRLFFIGYNVSAARMEEHCYDLLASEARLASFVAIASGAVPEEHWLHLGRPIGRVAGTRALLSWSGTLFEYLMPELLLREADATLIGHSCAAAVREQIAYGRRHGIPWGISESGYYQFDAQQNYQYRAFGVPALGFKRGLDDDLVAAPYACVLALSVAPAPVLENLDRFGALGAWGRFGLYEAVDFTAARRAPGERAALVRSFMAHHQGMVLAALDNFLNGDPLVRRFRAEPLSQTAELLLYERPPRHAPLERPQLAYPRVLRAAPRAIAPWPAALDGPFPQAHVLANGRYSVLGTEVGGGGSRWRDLALTRWAPDTTLDDDGFRIYLQDLTDGRFRSLFRDPGADPGSRRALFAAHMIELHERCAGVTARQRITVVPDADVEIRLLSLSSEGRRRRVAVVGYAEVVLGDAMADRRHPAFSKLFVQSEYADDEHALLFHRRARAPGERPLYLVHMLALPRAGARPLGHESSREAFLGRGGTTRAPGALARRRGRLSGTVGATLDPIMALAATVELPPHRTRELAFITAVADSRAGALELARHYRSLAELEWTFELASQRAEEELASRGLVEADLPALTSLLSLLLYPHPALRVAAELRGHVPGGHSLLWRHAVSGDLPILLVRIGQTTHAPLLPVLLRAQAYWHDRGVATDLVILNEHAGTYDASVDDQVLRAIADAGAQGRLHRPGGGIFVLQADQLAEGEVAALLGAARVVLDGGADSLAPQIEPRLATPAALPPLVVSAADADASPPLERPTDLQFDNGLGGFSADGTEYVIHLRRGEHTPAPWVNVIANPRCGFVVSERGAGYTWVGNSGENRLTPWTNDPVVDEPGESVYLRDEESGAIWSPTPAPAWGGDAYLIRHGVGYSIFEHRCREIDQRLRVFVPEDDPVKVTELQLVNRSARARRLTVTYYLEWVLGDARPATQASIIPAFDPGSETLTAHNPWNDEASVAVAFVAASQRLHGFTADRSEFLGRHGDRARPAALARIGLASTVGSGADPCAALQVHVDLPAGATRTVHFLLGQCASHEEALQLARQYRDAATAQAAWDAMRARWESLLAARTVQSPDPALNLMLNRWLPYQALSARVRGRTGLYQSSGAYGFRDQLQDVAALFSLAPELCRAHLLEAAAHQFEEGDVLHWWHPPSGAGIRSRCSDDLLWLPFVTAHYVETTGDASVLSAAAAFLTGQPLGAAEVERYARFASGGQTGSLYDHCLRALEKAGGLGPHGLPLFGGGDWNDGMNRVGVRGRGESIWLGWFLCATLTRFAPLCETMHEPERAAELRQRVAALRAALEASGWDGRWYRRGYYDDGTPLGSAERVECRIDSIAQSWAVLSGVADPQRAQVAMQSLHEQLVRPDDRLVLLLAPPFDRSTQHPGYIKGYPPGIRENGGHYSHAAVWAVWAFAALGDTERAARLFADLLPIGRALTPASTARYRVEPYVMAADIYSAAPHGGRGGWTWYTGAAGWAYRFGWEMLLGLRAEADGWRLDPSLPSDWRGCRLTLRDGATVYEIEINAPAPSRGVASIELDGTALADGSIPRLRDGATHRVIVTLRPIASRR
jgi:cyclic beta-1,2-glucan synthetase